MSDLRHIFDPVLSSLKMEGIRFFLIWKLLYMFLVVPPPIIRSANNCIYSIWYLSHRYCYLPLSWKSWNRFERAVGGVCAPDDGGKYHQKHVEQFPDKINCVMLHLVGYILKYALTYLCYLTRYWLQASWWWHNIVETCCSSIIICQLIVHWLDIVKNKKTE
jgi:hypothetical protein